MPTFRLLKILYPSNEYLHLYKRVHLHFGRRHIRLQIKPALGKYRLRSLTLAILQTFVNDLYREGYSKSSLEICASIVNNALKQAVHPWGYIKENPMQ